jgi:hypothetical protein
MTPPINNLPTLAQPSGANVKDGLRPGFRIPQYAADLSGFQKN